MPSSPTRRKTLAFAIVGLTGAALSLGSRTSGAGESGKPAASDRPLKIVLHVSDANSWAAAFSSLKNLTSQGPDAQLRVIVDGSGVYMMQGSTDTSLPGFVRVVPAAVVALADAQYAGYAYVKP